ncbi:MAG: hypothetical protein FWB96_11825 [Defluviitaleaceae bacterium]|nr:hypothetical protein [Defluviitaleaceae bacterium]MCL2263776.1 hypothetical protein [Defluviitaleaceae bacterium]
MRSVPIILDRERTLRFGLNGLSALCRRFKCPVAKLGEHLSEDNMYPEDIASFIHAGLIFDDKELTIEMVMDLIDEYSDLNTAMIAIGEAFEAAFGENNKETDNPNANRAARRKKTPKNSQ